MIKKHYNILALCAFLCIHTMACAGGLEKGFESLRLRDYYGAKKQFEKLRYKEPIGANYGLSMVHYERKNPFYDIDLALDYCNRADSLYEFVSLKEIERLEKSGVQRKNILEFKQKISQRAFEDLRSEFSEEKLQYYLKQYRFSSSYSQAVDIRDSIAFARAVSENSYLGYRDFITEFPGAKQRAKADSLYALRFFEEKTVAGNLDDYKLFVHEFPTNPYAIIAYDTLYKEVESKGTSDAYEEYIKSYSPNQNTPKAWRSINLLALRDYQESSIKELLHTFPQNPYKEMLERDLSLMRDRFFVVNINGGKQLIDLKGKPVGPVLEQIAEFKQGIAKVVQDGKVGYLDKAGKMVIPAKYSDGFDFSDGIAVVELDGKFGALDRFGDLIIPCKYDELGNMKSGLMAYELGDNSGFLDWNGKEVLGLGFDYVSDFLNGIAVVRVDGLYGAIDDKGNYTIPCQFDWVEESVDGLSRVRQGDLIGLYKHNRGLILPVEYTAIGADREGLRLISKEGVYGYANSRGDVELPMIFDYHEALLEKLSFVGDYAVFLKRDKQGVIDRAGNVLVEAKYDELVNTGYTIFPFKRNGKWGHVDNGGYEFKTLYDWVGPYTQGLSKVKKGDKFGMIDLNGKAIIPINYQSLDAIPDTEYLIFTAGSSQGLLTRTGEVSLEPIYDRIIAANIRYLRLNTAGQDELYDLSEGKIVWSAKQ